jgi:hypothetical protein
MVMTIFSQEILVVENTKSPRNFKYYCGDEIMFRTERSESRITDEIMDMSDSSLILIASGEVLLTDIYGIYRENWLIKTIRGLTLLGGVAYFGIDSFNRLINNDSPVVLVETVIISGSLIAVSFGLIPLNQRKYNTKKKWEMRVIDLGRF